MPSLLSIHSARRQNLALAILRIVAGIVFFAHGSQKLFEYGFTGVSGAFAQIGVPLPGITGPLVAVVEFVGGTALVLGLFTRLVAFALAIDMLGAVLLVHLKGGFFLPTGVEFTMTLLAATVALVLAGPGAPALDGAIAARRGRVR